MSGTHIESFCERCGTKYAFEQPVQRGRLLKDLGRTLGILGEESSETAAAVALRDPFHGVFRFCLECRQYTCPNCWNESAGFCQGCVPLSETTDAADAEAFAAMEAASDVRDALAEIRLLGSADAWPGADLPEPEPQPVAEPEPELIAAPEPEPEPVVVAVPAEPATPFVIATDQLFAGPWDDQAAMSDAQLNEDTSIEDWSVLTQDTDGEPEAELVAAVAEPDLEVVAVAAVAEPEAELVAAVAEPEPELIAAVAEPEAEPVAVMAEPEPELIAAVAEPEAEPVAVMAEPEPVAAVAVPEPEPEFELPLAAMTPSLPAFEPLHEQPISHLPAAHVHRDEPAYPMAASAEAAPASRLGTLFGRGRKPQPQIQNPAPVEPTAPTSKLAAGWSVTAPDDTVWPPHSPVYQPPVAQPQSAATTGRPSLLGPRPVAGYRQGAVPSGIRPCYQCALPLSASARFCRRCGSAQQPGV